MPDVSTIKAYLFRCFLLSTSLECQKGKAYENKKRCDTCAFHLVGKYIESKRHQVIIRKYGRAGQIRVEFRKV